MRTTACVLGVGALLGAASGGHIKIEQWSNVLDGDKPCGEPAPSGLEGEVPSGGCIMLKDVQGQDMEITAAPFRIFTCSEDGSSVKVQYFSDDKCQDAVDYNKVMRKDFVQSLEERLQSQPLQEWGAQVLLRNDPDLLQLSYPDSYKNGECTTVLSAGAFGPFTALTYKERYTIANCKGNEVEKARHAWNCLLLLLLVSFLFCSCMCCIGCRSAYKRRARGTGSAGNHPLIMATAVQTHTNEFSTAATVAAEWGDTPGRFDGR